MAGEEDLPRFVEIVRQFNGHIQLAGFNSSPASAVTRAQVWEIICGDIIAGTGLPRGQTPSPGRIAYSNLVLFFRMLHHFGYLYPKSDRLVNSFWMQIAHAWPQPEINAGHARSMAEFWQNARVKYLLYKRGKADPQHSLVTTLVEKWTVISRYRCSDQHASPIAALDDDNVYYDETEICDAEEWELAQRLWDHILSMSKECAPWGHEWERNIGLMHQRLEEYRNEERERVRRMMVKGSPHSPVEAEHRIEEPLRIKNCANRTATTTSQISIQDRASRTSPVLISQITIKDCAKAVSVPSDFNIKDCATRATTAPSTPTEFKIRTTAKSLSLRSRVGVKAIVHDRRELFPSGLPPESEPEEEVQAAAEKAESSVQIVPDVPWVSKNSGIETRNSPRVFDPVKQPEDYAMDAVGDTLPSLDDVTEAAEKVSPVAETVEQVKKVVTPNKRAADGEDDVEVPDAKRRRRSLGDDKGEETRVEEKRDDDQEMGENSQKMVDSQEVDNGQEMEMSQEIGKSQGMETSQVDKSQEGDKSPEVGQSQEMAQSQEMETRQETDKSQETDDSENMDSQKDAPNSNNDDSDGDQEMDLNDDSESTTSKTAHASDDDRAVSESTGMATDGAVEEKATAPKTDTASIQDAVTHLDISAYEHESLLDATQRALEKHSMQLSSVQMTTTKLLAEQSERLRQVEKQCKSLVGANPQATDNVLKQIQKLVSHHQAVDAQIKQLQNQAESLSTAHNRNARHFSTQLENGRADVKDMSLNSVPIIKDIVNMVGGHKVTLEEIATWQKMTKNTITTLEALIKKVSNALDSKFAFRIEALEAASRRHDGLEEPFKEIQAHIESYTRLNECQKKGTEVRDLRIAKLEAQNEEIYNKFGDVEIVRAEMAQELHDRLDAATAEMKLERQKDNEKADKALKKQWQGVMDEQRARMADVCDDVANAVHNKLHDEVAEMRAELRDEVYRELYSELRDKLRDQIRDEMCSEMQALQASFQERFAAMERRLATKPTPGPASRAEVAALVQEIKDQRAITDDLRLEMREHRLCVNNYLQSQHATKPLPHTPPRATTMRQQFDDLASRKEDVEMGDRPPPCAEKERLIGALTDMSRDSNNDTVTMSREMVEKLQKWMMRR